MDGRVVSRGVVRRRAHGLARPGRAAPLRRNPGCLRLRLCSCFRDNRDKAVATVISCVGACARHCDGACACACARARACARA
eukprot:2628457-Lingulodinium_polyedra.AAC.1